ncbi:hypothetical protein [Bacillus toyonensis]|uniref:Uncharacterized protein n=1 Tax=Bacillus toyonensis TaxID=155322 RepID=A0A2A8H9Z8_9BACI|nr:hypothetical protein [Bacillus toyonensis]PEQ00057.1 hypothetical protein CN585_23285 [Bacillus toyonensis]
MNKATEALIKKLVGNTPIIMNVTITVDELIIGAEPKGIFDKCVINHPEKLQKEMDQHANN